MNQGQPRLTHPGSFISTFTMTFTMNLNAITYPTSEHVEQLLCVLKVSDPTTSITIDEVNQILALDRERLFEQKALSYLDLKHDLLRSHRSNSLKYSWHAGALIKYVKRIGDVLVLKGKQAEHRAVYIDGGWLTLIEDQIVVLDHEVYLQLLSEESESDQYEWATLFFNEGV